MIVSLSELAFKDASQPQKLAPPPGLDLPAALPSLGAAGAAQPARVLPESLDLQPAADEALKLCAAGGLKQASPVTAPAPLPDDLAAAGLSTRQTSASERSGASEELAWLSVGSVGHPHGCAEACRYIKRKGGCRVGANCPSCHLCFWRRAEEKHGLGAEEVDADKSGAHISLGTRGHPHACGAPCRYVRRKGGCRDGPNCLNCHACIWQRDRQQDCETQVDVHKPETPEQPAHSEPDIPPGIFGESGKTLRGLIAVLLEEKMSQGAEA